MDHENEYADNLISMLEFIWGEGYMAPGGPGNVAQMLSGLETQGKRILDIGCGIGGPAFEMATTFGAEVVGIDIEAPLIERAKEAAEKKGLANQCSFETVEAGPLVFPDASFDIVVTSGAITQVADKVGIFKECHRVLRPGGAVSCYDWLKSEATLSEDMYYWFKMEGLTYALGTLEEYEAHLQTAGFADVEVKDVSPWYRQEARREYELIKGDLYERMVERLGQKDADYFVENWRSMVVVIENGEMLQAYCRGRKPG